MNPKEIHLPLGIGSSKLKIITSFMYNNIKNYIERSYFYD